MNKKLLTIDKLIFQLEFAPYFCEDTNQYNQYFNAEYLFSKYPKIGNNIKINNEIQLTELTRLEKYYWHQFAVYVGNEQVATLSTDCRQHGQRNSIKLQLNNHLFYTLPGWKHYYQKIISELNLRFKAISMLEIACDIQSAIPILPQICKIYRYSNFLEHNTEIIYKPLDGKLKCSVIKGATYEFGSGSKKKDNSGKRGSGKKIKVYDKTKEIKDNNNEKQYITAYYKANGFSDDIVVERIEAELTNAWLSKFVIYECQLSESNFLERIFKAAVANTFKFRKIDSICYDKNRNKKTEVLELISFNNLNTEPLYHRPNYKNISEKEISKRQTIKTVLHHYIKTGSTQSIEFIKHYTTSIAEPKGVKWQSLLRRYAKEYEGRMTDAIAERINEFVPDAPLLTSDVSPTIDSNLYHTLTIDEILNLHDEKMNRIKSKTSS